MAGRLRLTAGTASWVALASLLASGALIGQAFEPGLIDWQPLAALREPWRAWSAAFVHWNAAHLAAGVAGAAIVAAFGVAARVPPAASLAWLAAWPAGHAMLALQPGLQHYGGLSGVLHAGVAVVAVFLVMPVQARPEARSRILGLAVLAGLAVKLLTEAPWDATLRQDPLLDITVAPGAHATGAFAGLACAVTACALRYHRRPR